MDTREIAKLFAGEMGLHRDKLTGNARESQIAQASLDAAAKEILEQRDAQQKSASTVLSHWRAAGSGEFEKATAKLGSDLRTTASATTEAAKIVGGVTDALAGRHTVSQRLIDEYVTKASKILDGALAVSGAGSPAALINAVGQVTDLVGKYTKESGGHLKNARDEMVEAARKLHALQKEIDHDGIADATRKAKPGHPAKKPHDKDKGGKTKPSHSGKVDDILRNARKHLGYHEGPGNRNKFGPAAPWCSSFATSMWRKAGVNIPLLPFTGDVYNWGRKHGLAYGKNDLKQARPGDVLLFGSGPGYGASKHIGIVEKVEGNTVTTIEGNSSDQVRRVTHKLSSATFYGGVHPK
ncbi:CHAP domain-containing protein [Amycolatopsis anabasis]|uniref:CHAP domain-containing protein n=1 Tax=Amycolatopsis anabasis TaxID=1840409 RepID=UPI00131B8E3D|nr:CHAP domain-containing protein [Amycolatopsis anabasis]